MSSIDSIFDSVSKNLYDEFDRKGGKEIRLGKAKSQSLFNEFNDFKSVIDANRESAKLKIEKVNLTLFSLKDKIVTLKQQLLIEKAKSHTNNTLISSLESQLNELQEIISQLQSQQNDVFEFQNSSLSTELEQFKNDFYGLQQVIDDLRNQIFHKDHIILELQTKISSLRLDLDSSESKCSKLDNALYYS